MCLGIEYRGFRANCLPKQIWDSKNGGILDKSKEPNLQLFCVRVRGEILN